MSVLDSIVVNTKKIKAEKYVAMSDEERGEYRVIRVVPPSLHDNDDFGSIEVKLKRPIYEVIL